MSGDEWREEEEEEKNVFSLDFFCCVGWAVDDVMYMYRFLFVSECERVGGWTRRRTKRRDKTEDLHSIGRKKEVPGKTIRTSISTAVSLRPHPFCLPADKVESLFFFFFFCMQSRK